MIKKLLYNINSIDRKIIKIMLLGLNFSFVICLISCIISIYYISNPISHILFNSGIILFKTGLSFGATFFICAFAIDKIKKQLEI